MPATKKIYIIYYSMYGHILKLAEKIKEGIDEVEGLEGVIYQVAETLPEEVLGKMHAPPKADYPIMDPHLLDEADGIIFGFPTRFGVMAAQMKTFMDATGQHWTKQSLAGKPCGIFTSTATQVGGQETTILTAIPFIAHHGMIFVPSGSSKLPEVGNVTETRGGGPFGAGTLAGPDGSRQPSETELAIAKNQGRFMAEITKKLAA